jgi:ribosome-associated protein
MMEHSPGTAQDSSQDMQKVVLELAELLKDKKARDILVLDLAHLTSITDYFILATVNSSTQSKALIRFIEEYLKEYDIRPLVKNDEYESPWVLLDYNYFIIHLFLREGREYYQLEKLWSDAPVVYSDEGGLL